MFNVHWPRHETDPQKEVGNLKFEAVLPTGQGALVSATPSIPLALPVNHSHQSAWQTGAYSYQDYFLRNVGNFSFRCLGPAKKRTSWPTFSHVSQFEVN